MIKRIGKRTLVGQPWNLEVTAVAAAAAAAAATETSEQSTSC